MNTTIPIIDAHHHLWDFSKLHYPWLQDEPLGAFVASNPLLRENYLVCDLIADCEGLKVVKFVHVEVLPAADHRVAEVAWLQSLADETGGPGLPHAIVGAVDLLAEDFEATIEAQCAHKNLRGLRQLISWEPTAYLCEETWVKNYARLADWGLSFDMHPTVDQLMDVANVVAQYPGIPVALNHFGLANINDPESMKNWRKGMKALSALDHVSVKLSGLSMLDSDVRLEKHGPVVRETVEMFRPERCMFGSNFPVDKVAASYKTVLSVVQESLADLSGEEKRAVFYDTAARFYRI